MDLASVALATSVSFTFQVTLCDVNLPLGRKAVGLRDATVVDFAVIFHCCLYNPLWR